MSRRRKSKSQYMGSYTRKRNAPTKVFVVMGVFLLAICIGLGIYFFQKKKNQISADDLLKQYVGYVEKKDYNKMYEMLSKESQAAITKKAFVERNKNIYEGISADDVKLKITQKDEKTDDSIYVTYQETMQSVAGKISFTNQAIFLKDKEQKSGLGLKWKDNLILADLSSTQKIKVQKDKALRGEILDRNNKILAENGTVASVGIVPGKLGDNKEANIEQLAQLLDVTVDKINKALSASWVKDDSFVPIKSLPQVDEQNIKSTIPDPDNVANNQLQEQLITIPGVKISTAAARVYPYKKIGAHLVGYVQNVTAEDLKKHPKEGYSSDSVIGRSGLESLYETKLKGHDGYRIFITDAQGNEISTVASYAKADGENVKLTIDADLESELYNTFAEDKSTHVALNPYTGEVLALVNTPSFDPNDFVLGMSQTKWDALNNDPNKPMYNRFRQTFAPGSSIKSIVSVIGIDNGTIDPNASEDATAVKSWQKDDSWGSYHVTTLHDYSPINLQNALIYSDNIYFAKAALQMGKDKLQDGFKTMGFEQKIPFEITMAKSQYANKDKDIASEIQLADSGYGQGQVLVNPLHLASMYSMFSNEGNMIKPYLLYQETKKPAYWLEHVTSQEHASLVEKDLEQVVNYEHGTGYGAHEDNQVLAGKTGTAEIKLTQADTNGTELGWFAVFTTDKNAAKPILLVSMTEDVKDRGGSVYVVKNDNAVLNMYFGNAQVPVDASISDAKDSADNGND